LGSGLSIPKNRATFVVAAAGKGCTIRSMQTRRWIVVVGLIALLLASKSPHPVAAAESKAKPLWTVELKADGLRKFRHGLVNDPGSEASVACTDQVVAVVFDAGVARDKDHVPSKSAPSGWRIVGLFFDRSSGAVLARRSWTEDTHTELFATADGNFLLHLRHFTGFLSDGPWASVLLLLSPKGDELKRIELRVNGDSKHQWWETQAAPSGKSVLLTHVQDDQREYHLLDADTLHERNSWKAIEGHKSRIASISDNEVLRIDQGIASIGAPGQPGHQTSLPAGASSLANDSLVLTRTGRPPRLLLTTLTNDKVSSVELHLPSGVQSIEPLFTCAKGTHLGAIVSAPGSQRHPMLYVWHIPGQEPIFAAGVHWTVISAQAALAPDGSWLAVVERGRVSVFRLAN